MTYHVMSYVYIYIYATCQHPNSYIFAMATCVDDWPHLWTPLQILGEVPPGPAGLPR